VPQASGCASVISVLCTGVLIGRFHKPPLLPCLDRIAHRTLRTNEDIDAELFEYMNRFLVPARSRASHECPFLIRALAHFNTASMLAGIRNHRNLVCVEIYEGVCPEPRQNVDLRNHRCHQLPRPEYLTSTLSSPPGYPTEVCLVTLQFAR